MPSVFRAPHGARRAIRKLGEDIRDARLRRGLPAGLIAERAGISRPTMAKVEKGDPGVGIGIYAAVLQALNLLEGLGDLADAKNDPLGASAALERLPKRAVLPRKSAAAVTAPAKDGAP